MTFEAGKPGPRWPEALVPGHAARKLAFCILALALPLAGCKEDPFLGLRQDQTAASPADPSAAAPAEPAVTAESVAAPAISMVPTQVLQPAPDLFSSEEWALWDGQRTMGGRWVALPDIALSTRVRITNIETGTSTDGALILRDPGLAGPRLIVSSDTAQALGLRPGVAAAVELVALEFAAVPENPAGETAIADPSAPGGSASEAGAEGAQLGPVPVARPARRTAAAGTPATDVPAVVPKTPPETPPGKSNGASQGAPQESAPRQEPVPASAPATPEPPQAPPASTEPQPAETQAEPATETATPAPATTQPATPDSITDGLRYIQAGIFGDPTNATRLIGQLQAAGLPANAVIMKRGSGNLTRVLVGPFDSIEARSQALHEVRRIGPDDATPVRD